MPTLHIYCNLPVDAAIAARSPIAGELDIPLTAEELAELHYHHLHDVASPYIDIVAAPNRARLEVRACGWPAVIEALRVEFLGKKNRISGIEKLVTTRGTPDQITRWRAGRLSEGEIGQIARGVAFVTFEGQSRYVRIEYDRGNGTAPRNPLPHTARCSRPEPSFEVTEQRSLDKTTHDTFQTYQAAAARAMESWKAMELDPYFSWIRVTAKRHAGRCPECGGELDRMAALVEVTWGGRTLSREYAL